MVTVIERRKADPSAPRPPVSAAAKARAKGYGTGLYKARTPIYPKLAHGQWRNIKWAMLIVTLTIYYATPWIRWDRPGDMPDQAVLIDFERGRFFFFIQLWPQEVYFITGLLVLAALALFLSNALFGRLWCGYSCPQTVWTDLFIYVERMFEGDRNARMRLDAAPWSFDKAWRKIGKHLFWLGVAFGTGGAWIFYFRDAPTLLAEFWTGRAPLNSYISCFLLTGTTYLFAGWMREQVCFYMCPWPRIQAAMIDVHSLQITYRRDRAEPRGAHKKTESWEGRGDCIDCHQCVVVCPVGIDIRDGAQFECINCGLCADACDEVMLKVERPVGLIGYDTDAAVSAREAGKPVTYRLFRPRTVLYAACLVLVGALMVTGLATRASLDLHAIRDRNPLFVRMQDGAVRNGYTLKIANRDLEPRRVQLTVEGLAAPLIRTPGAAASQGALDLSLAPDQVTSVRLFVTARPAATAETVPVTFRVLGGDDAVQVQSTFFTGAVR